MRAKSLLRRRKVPNPLGLLKNYLHYNMHSLLSHKPLWPRAMTIYVTYRCNMRCRMCGIWKLNRKHAETELSLQQFEEILANPLFKDLRIVNINGGEPNLRTDLVEISEMLLRRLPRLSALSLNSNGIPPAKTVENAKRISALCRENDIRFSVSLSLHLAGDGFDYISGVENAFVRVTEAFRNLKNLSRNSGFFLSANCVLTNMNLFGLDELIAWGEREEIPLNFVLGEVRDRFDNAEMADEIRIKEKDKVRLVGFLRKLSRSRGAFLQHALRYRQLADMIEFDTRRRLACHYFMGGVILGSDGLLYYCKFSDAIGDCTESRADEIYFDENNLRYRATRLKKDLCLTCPPNTYNKMEIEKDLPRVARFLCFGR